jgi:maleylpyruvate isomerase
MTGSVEPTVPGPHDTLSWFSAGEQHFATALDALTDDELAAPSLLPGWSRQTVVAHVARNADALVNLLDWARTGVETPMYPSVEARAAGIEQTARQSPAELRADCAAASARLSAAFAALPGQAWTAPIRTAQGREVTAEEIPWMRCRENWVHAVDLACGAEFDHVPADVLAALVDDVLAMWARRGTALDVCLVATDGGRRWGDQSAVTATGPLPALVAWLTGRSGADALAIDGPVPELPTWL